MQLFIGGACAGKRDAVTTRFPQARWWCPQQGQRLSEASRIMQASTPLVIHGLLGWLAVNLSNTSSDEARTQWCEDLCVLNHVAETSRSPLIVIVEEVGRGIVPMEQSQRRLRDLNGWLCQDAASRAEQVWYVRHGLVQAVHK